MYFKTKFVLIHSASLPATHDVANIQVNMQYANSC